MELIEKYISFGSLYVNDKLIDGVVKCEFEDDYYSNKLMRGKFDFSSIKSVEFPIKYLPFRFEDQNEKIVILGEAFFIIDKYEFTKFKAEEVFKEELKTNGKPKKISVQYKIPYKSFLKRYIYQTNDTEEYILKYSKEIGKINIEGKEIVFKDDIIFMDDFGYESFEPDIKIKRIIYPRIDKDISEGIDIQNELKKLTDLMDDVILMLSLIYFDKFSCFGYDADIIDENGDVCQWFYYKTSKKKCGDHKKKFNASSEFIEYFKWDKVEEIINSFVKLEDRLKMYLTKIIYSFLSIKDARLFEHKFMTAYFTLEYISKFITDEFNIKINKNENETNTEKRIKAAAKYFDIDLEKYNFIISPKKKAKQKNKPLWYISDYRNELAHFNYEKPDYRSLINEKYKIMDLIRKLIFGCINKKYYDFPFAEEDRYNRLNEYRTKLSNK